MGANGKSRRWLSRANWRSRKETTSGQARRLDKKIAEQLKQEELIAEEEDKGELNGR